MNEEVLPTDQIQKETPKEIRNRLIRQKQTDRQRVKYIEFQGTPNGETGCVTFADQNKQILGRFPLNRWGIEVLSEQFNKWLADTE